MTHKIITSKSGFTLIEMLTVIAIIAILAALITMGAGRAGEAKQKARVRAELASLESAIERYHGDQSFYPPQGTQPELPPLFYELSGTRFNTDNTYWTLTGGESEEISAATVSSFFGLGGFANSNPETAKNYFTGLKANQHAKVQHAQDIELLIVPVEGPADPVVLDKNGKPLNTWRYVSNKATNNPATFDLWADIVVGNKTVTIGNWKE